jgi:hypothetical protein
MFGPEMMASPGVAASKEQAKSSEKPKARWSILYLQDSGLSKRVAGLAEIESPIILDYLLSSVGIPRSYPLLRQTPRFQMKFP